MNYYSHMFGSFTFISFLADDETLPDFAKKTLIKAASLIAEQKPMEALTLLCQMRTLALINHISTKVFVSASECLATAIVSQSQSLNEIRMVRDKLGPWAKKIDLSIIMYT